MPIGPLCRACGDALRPDLGWCATCYAPVTPFAARPPLHEPGTFAGTPSTDIKTSPVEGGAHDDGSTRPHRMDRRPPADLPMVGPTGAVGEHLAEGRVADGAPPTLIERFREHHPALGRETRVGPTARLAILALAAVAAVALFLTKEDADRYLFAAPVLFAGLTIGLTSWDDL